LVGNAGNDRVLGGTGSDSIFGGTGNDTLDGSSGNDYLDGGAGVDIMSGGPGNDTYIVDNSGDVVLEVIAGGTGGKDLILTSVSLVAPDNVEYLQAVAGSAIDLTGNLLDNILTGNEKNNILLGGTGLDTLIGGLGNDTLNGGAGIDKMSGGAGDDIYYVDSKSDTVVELANEGRDTVKASTSYTLSSNVEDLFLLDGGNYSAAGNSLNNHIYGNSGDNILAGGLGVDTLEGGFGNDIYVLSDNSDVIIDTGGTDTIRSPLDVDLKKYAGIENIELVGIADTSATGNAFNNLIIGNAGDNTLEGLLGVDTLTGGNGSDQFVIASNGLGLRSDLITDFTSGFDLLVIDIASFGLLPSQLDLLGSGTVDPAAFIAGAGVAPVTPNHHFMFDTASGMLRFDIDGSGSAAAVDLAQITLVGTSQMTPQDIFIAI
jgi:Ca2+-binding RTX toxin-like protein